MAANALTLSKLLIRKAWNAVSFHKCYRTLWLWFTKLPASKTSYTIMKNLEPISLNPSGRHCYPVHRLLELVTAQWAYLQTSLYIHEENLWSLSDLSKKSVAVLFCHAYAMLVCLSGHLHTGWHVWNGTMFIFGHK